MKRIPTHPLVYWLVGAFIIVLLVGLEGCAATACSTHPDSLACAKETAKGKYYRACLMYWTQELNDELLAGFYNTGAIAQHCRKQADKRYT